VALLKVAYLSLANCVPSSSSFCWWWCLCLYEHPWEFIGKMKLTSAVTARIGWRRCLTLLLLSGGLFASRVVGITRKLVTQRVYHEHLVVVCF